MNNEAKAPNIGEAIPPEKLMMVAAEILRDDGLRDPALPDIAHFLGESIGMAYLCDERNDPWDDRALSDLLLTTVKSALAYQERWIAAATARGMT